MSRKTAAWIVLIAGAGIAIYGVWLIYIPAALVLAGLVLGAVAMFGIDVDEEAEK